MSRILPRSPGAYQSQVPGSNTKEVKVKYIPFPTLGLEAEERMDPDKDENLLECSYWKIELKGATTMSAILRKFESLGFRVMKAEVRGDTMNVDTIKANSSGKRWIS